MAPNNVTEDSRILFAQMQNSRLWQLSAKQKYLQRVRMPAELSAMAKGKSAPSQLLQK